MICGCGFVLWCAVGLFCGVVSTVIVPCFVMLWDFFFFFYGGGGGCGCG